MNRCIQRLIGITLIALLSGCGLTLQQKTDASAFGHATAAMGTFSADELVNIRQGIIRMNQQLVAIDHTKKIDNLKFDRPTSAKATAARLAAAKALKNYGDILSTLANENRTEQLGNAAQELIGNTSLALNQNISEENADLINRVIVGIGTLWIEQQKAKALKTLVPAYHQTVGDLADRLEEDFSLSDDALGFLKAYDSTAKRLKNAAFRLVNAGDQYSVLERDRAVEALVMAEQAIARAKDIERQANTSIKALKKANDALLSAIEERPYARQDIQGYVKEIQALLNLYQVLSHE